MNKVTLMVIAVVVIVAAPLGIVGMSWDCTRSADCVATTALIADAVGVFFVLGVLGSFAWSVLCGTGEQQAKR